MRLQEGDRQGADLAQQPGQQPAAAAPAARDRQGADMATTGRVGPRPSRPTPTKCPGRPIRRQAARRSGRLLQPREPLPEGAAGQQPGRRLQAFHAGQQPGRRLQALHAPQSDSSSCSRWEHGQQRTWRVGRRTTSGRSSRKRGGSKGTGLEKFEPKWRRMLVVFPGGRESSQTPPTKTKQQQPKSTPTGAVPRTYPPNPARI